MSRAVKVGGSPSDQPRTVPVDQLFKTPDQKKPMALPNRSDNPSPFQARFPGLQEPGNRKMKILETSIKSLLIMFIVNLASVVNADLIVNGSLESPSVPNGSYTNFGAGSTAITGWTVVGVDSSIVNTNFMQSGVTFQAQAGIQWADMAGVTSNSNSSGLRQLVTTVPGQAYLIEFYVGSATASPFFFPATVDLSIDGGARVSYFNPTGPANMLNWKHFSVPFTAAGSTTSLTFFNGSAPGNYISPLDNVSLTAFSVPEPSALLLLGIACVPGLVSRRRGHTSARSKSRFPSVEALSISCGLFPKTKA